MTQPPQVRPREDPAAADLRAMIVDGDAEKTVLWAEVIGRQLGEERLNTTQIRRFFAAVRQVDMDWPRPDQPPNDAREKRARRQLILLKPQLAYQVGRNPNDPGLKHLKRVLDPAIDQIEGDRERFGHFLDFFEAILAYHRFHGGR